MDRHYSEQIRRPGTKAYHRSSSIGSGVEFCDLQVHEHGSRGHRRPCDHGPQTRCLQCRGETRCVGGLQGDPPLGNARRIVRVVALEHRPRGVDWHHHKHLRARDCSRCKLHTNIGDTGPTTAEDRERSQQKRDSHSVFHRPRKPPKLLDVKRAMKCSYFGRRRGPFL